MTAVRRLERLQGLGIVAAILAVIGLAGWGALGPILETRQSIADAKARIQRFETSARSAVADVRNIDTSNVISTDITAGDRSIAIQRALVDDTRTAGLQMRQLSTARPRHMDRGLVRLSYSLDVAGDLEAWAGFLKLLAARRPALFFDKILVKSGPASRGDLNLSIEMELSAYALAKAAAK